jgi:hypothetical protein
MTLLVLPLRVCALPVCRRVSPEDIQKCDDRFNKSKMVHSIMRHVAETTGESLEVRALRGCGVSSLCRQQGAWPRLSQPANTTSTPPPARHPRTTTRTCTAAPPHAARAAPPPRCLHKPQELYKQIAWPLYKAHGHAFEGFKNMVADDGAAVIAKLEEERGPLTVVTPQVRCLAMGVGWGGASKSGWRRRLQLQLRLHVLPALVCACRHVARRLHTAPLTHVTPT